MSEICTHRLSILNPFSRSPISPPKANLWNNEVLYLATQQTSHQETLTGGSSCPQNSTREGRQHTIFNSQIASETASAGILYWSRFAAALRMGWEYGFNSLWLSQLDFGSDCYLPRRVIGTVVEDFADAHGNMVGGGLKDPELVQLWVWVVWLSQSLPQRLR